MLVPVGVTLADYIAAVKRDEPTHIRITFTGQNITLLDEDIETSGIQFTDFMNGDTDLIFGKAVMESVSIPIIHTAKVNSLIWTGEFKLEIGQEINGVTNWITHGYFSGNRPSKVNSVDIIDFVANDRMILFERLAKDWVNSLTFPKTLKQLFQSLCSYCGVGYANGDELNTIASKSFASFPYQYEGQTCREILAQMAEACGCYARINSSGKCQMVWFSDHTSDYTVDEQDEFDPVDIFDYTEGKTWAELESFKWADLENFRWCDLGGTKSLFEIDVLNVIDTVRGTSTKYPSQKSGNTYTIVDNPFLSSQSEMIAIYGRLSAFGGYIPMSINCLGNALIEPGDIINVVVNGNTLQLPIFCKRATWNGALVDNYETTGQINRSEVSVDSVRNISENTKYYNRQSGIDIMPEGIEINGAKYVKIYGGSSLDIKSGSNLNIESGGNFWVTANDFTINSVLKNISIGDWELNELGVQASYHNNNIDKDVSIAFGKYGQAVSSQQLPSTGFEGSFVATTGTYPYAGVWYLTNVFTDNYYSRIEVYLDYDDMKILGRYGQIGGSTYGYRKVCIGNIQNRWDVYADKVDYNTLVQNSSRDIKHNINDLPSMGDKIDNLRPVSFVYDKDKEENKRMGLIYEETVETMPEICTQDESNKAINYVELIPALIKEIQELRARVKQLEERE